MISATTGASSNNDKKKEGDTMKNKTQRTTTFDHDYTLPTIYYCCKL